MQSKELIYTAINHELALSGADIRVSDIIANPTQHEGWWDKYTLTKEQEAEWKDFVMNLLKTAYPRWSKKRLESEYGYLALQYGLRTC